MPVTVETIVIRIATWWWSTSARAWSRDGRLGVDVRYPGVSAQLNPDPSDFAHDERHIDRHRSPAATTDC